VASLLRLDEDAEPLGRQTGKLLAGLKYRTLSEQLLLALVCLTNMTRQNQNLKKKTSFRG
jgi:hypothetical protein